MRSKSQFIILSIVLIFAAGWIVYYHSINGGFVADDEVIVKKNVFIRSIRYLPDIFTSHFLRGTGYSCNYYRPLHNVSCLVDYKLYGLNLKGYHVTNILLHILVALSFWGLTPL